MPPERTFWATNLGFKRWTKRLWFRTRPISSLATSWTTNFGIRSICRIRLSRRPCVLDYKESRVFRTTNFPCVSVAALHFLRQREASDEKHDANNEKQIEQEFRDPCRRGCNSSEPEQPGNERDDEKNDSPT